MKNSDSPKERFFIAAGMWQDRLKALEGWQDFQKTKILSTLLHDDPFFRQIETESVFQFPSEIEMEHDVIMCYFQLLSVEESLKDCE